MFVPRGAFCSNMDLSDKSSAVVSQILRVYQCCLLIKFATIRLLLHILNMAVAEILMLKLQSAGL